MPSREELVQYIEKKGPQTTAQLAQHFDKENYGAVSQCVTSAKAAGLVENDGRGTPWRIVGSPAPAAADGQAAEAGGSREEQLLELLPATAKAIMATLGWSPAVLSGVMTRMKAKGLLAAPEVRGGAWQRASGKAKAKAKARAKPGAGSRPGPKTIADVVSKLDQKSGGFSFEATLRAERQKVAGRLAAIDTLLEDYGGQ